MWQPRVDNFFLRRGEIVLDPALLNHRAVDVINAVSGAPFVIARLTDAADVNKIFFTRIDPEFIRPLTFHSVAADEGDRHW